MTKAELRILCAEAAASHPITKVDAKRRMSDISRAAYFKRAEEFLARSAR